MTKFPKSPHPQLIYYHAIFPLLIRLLIKLEVWKLNLIKIINFSLKIFSFNPTTWRRQVNTNNCASRYRTLSGGIGNSPSPTHSSDDYVDDDEDEDDLTTNTAVLNGLTSSSANIIGNGGQQVGVMLSGVGSTSTNTNVANNLKSKRGNSSHLHKTSSAISYQKATVHYVSKLSEKGKIFAFNIIFELLSIRDLSGEILDC